MPDQKSYVCIWAHTVDASSPDEAAKLAATLMIQQVQDGMTKFIDTGGKGDGPFASWYVIDGSTNQGKQLVRNIVNHAKGVLVRTFDTFRKLGDKATKQGATTKAANNSNWWEA